MWRNRNTGKIYTNHSDIREDTPNPTLPAIITDELLYEVGFAVVVQQVKMYDEYKEKLVEGDVVEEDGVWTQVVNVVPLTAEEKTAKVPQVVTRRQARQALMLEGYLSLVPAILEAIEDPIKRAMAQIEWEDSTEFERTHELVLGVGAALGLDSDGLDDLFIKAYQL